MQKITPEEFNQEEELILTDSCRVAGKLYEKGAKVKVGGNDKMQLLGSQKAVRPEKKEDKK